MALASISGPDMRRSLVGVGCTSCNVGEAAPTTTMRPRTRVAFTRPRTRSENETVSIVPGGPWKSIHAPSSSNADAGGARPTTSAVTVARVGSPAWVCSTRCRIPPRPSGRLLAPTRAPMLRTMSSPPNTFARPRSSVSAVASTTLSARSTAVISALSSRSVVCSVNCTS
jgi:hypothetical protein